MASTRELAPIEDGVTYPLDEFTRRAGLGRHAMREARAKGLKVIRLGNRAYVRGSDFNAFLGQLERTEGEVAQ
ncbi:MAG: hypothetical protein R3C20_00215 [Planctomycetaceae bacterium]